MKTLAAALGASVLVLVLLGSGIALLADRFWIGELAANLRWHLGVGALVAVPFLGFGGARWRTAVAAAVAAFHLVPAARLEWASPDPPSPGPEFRVASANVYADNRQADALERWLVSEDADLVAVLEVTEFWARYFETSSLLGGYEHSIVEPRPGAFGIALFSRLPLVSATVVEIGSPGLPYIEAIVDHEGCQMKVLVVHTFPPVSGPMTSARDHVLDEVLTRIDPSFPTVVVGDLNVTMYSPAFRRFVRDGELADSRAGFGRLATWMPLLGPAGLDLDHLFTTPGLGTRSRRVGPAFGSDHRPIAADLVRESGYCVPVPAPVPAAEGSGTPEERRSR